MSEGANMWFWEAAREKNQSCLREQDNLQMAEADRKNENHSQR